MRATIEDNSTSKLLAMIKDLKEELKERDEKIEKS